MASMSAPQVPPAPYASGRFSDRPDIIGFYRPLSPPAPLPWHVRHPTLAAGGIAAVLLFGALIAVHAEDAAPAKKAPDFVPIVVDRAQYEAAMGYLNDLPFKTALPLVKWLSELEDRAKRQWEADNAPKEEPKP